MTTTFHPTGTTPRRMDPLRKHSLAAGIFYLITFVSIPSLALYKAVRGPDYILGAGGDTEVLIAGLLEIIVALAGIGTAVALYPVVKRQNTSLALGFVGIRVLEAATIFSGVVTLLSVVTLRKTGAGAAALETARGLVAQHDWTFLLGQAILPGVNAVLLGTLMYKSRLVPRILPTLGLIGAPIIFASVIAKYFGLYDELSVWSVVGALPIALWEFSLGVWLTFKGFKTAPITVAMAAENAPVVAGLAHRESVAAK